MYRKLLLTIAAVAVMTSTAVPALSDEIVLISSHTRDFIGADAANGGTLKGVPLEAQALVVDRITLDGNKVAFRALDGKFVRAGVGAQSMLAAASAHIRGWETFEIVRVTNAKFAIKSVQSGKYVSLNANGRLTASAANIGSRETFSSRVADVPAPQPLPPVIDFDDDVDLAGNWRIHRVRTLDASLIPLPASIRGDSFVNVRANGRFTASTGCNDISGRVRAEEDLVQFTNVAATRMFCLNDAGAFEALLLVAFDHSSRVEDRGDELRFFDVNDDAVMTLRRN